VVQFTSVGAVGAICETIIIYILTVFGSTGPLTAKIISVEASISIMFLINDRYTFSDAGKSQLTNRIYRWMRSHAVRSGGIAVAFIMLWALTSQTQIRLILFGGDLWPTVANIIGIGCALSINYVAESLFTWKVQK
jgi:putative flippase GtrA